MSELRIRSEAAQSPWPELWLPRGVGNASGDAADNGPLMVAMAAALSAHFGMAVKVLPASEEEALDLVDGGGARLAALLLSLRLGGRADAATPGPRICGAAWARFQGQLRDVAARAGVWPAGLNRLVLLVSVPEAGGLEDLLEVMAPPGEVTAERALLRPSAGANPLVAAQLAAVPMRLRVELAAEIVSLGDLVPLSAGQVLAIQPVAEMRLRMGDHAVGLVTLQAGADGRQTATLVSLAMEHLGERT